MSDVLRRQIAITLLLIGVVVAVLAIEDLGPFDDPPTQADRARAAAEEFFAAAADGDSERFCEMLTADAREALRVSTAQRLQVDELPKCERILDVLAPVFAQSSLSVRYVSVSGDRARVEARFHVGDSGAQPRTILLEVENGEWRVSDPG